MPIVPADAVHLEQAAALLRGGAVVAMPTETVYGLAADALQPLACATIFEVKGRPHFDPLIVHLADAAMLEQVCSATAMADGRVQRLAERFWPGPLTLVLPKRDAVPDIVTSGLPTVAVRVPAHPVARELIRRVGRPLAAPSANRFGCLSPTTAAHVAAQLGDRVPLILDGGPCEIGVESTIMDLSESGDSAPPVLLRPGGLAAEELEAVLGPITSPASITARQEVRAPGQLARHYAPATRLRLLRPDEQPLDALRQLQHERPAWRFGFLGMTATPHGIAEAGFTTVRVLSRDGDLRRAAANLFAVLHELDGQQLDLILAQPAPDAGLGRAINDRLRRGSADKPA